MTLYVIRVTGTLSDGLLTKFPHLLVNREPAQTVLHGELPDQAALTGVLDQLDELGVHILEVVQVPERPPEVAGRAKSDRTE
jgi:hypothetical protein